MMDLRTVNNMLGENIKAVLKRKLQAYRTLCSAGNNCGYDYIVLNVLVYTLVVFLLYMLLLTKARFPLGDFFRAKRLFLCRHRIC